MRSLYRFSISLFIAFGFMSCSGVPSTPNQMRDKWADICSLGVVERFSVTYNNPDVVRNQSAPNCYNAVSSGLTPKEGKEYVELANSMFRDVCMSDLTLKARIVVKGRSISQYNRTCSR